MIELQKHVLNQVYHNHDLFTKELIKSKKWLSNTEIESLKKWLQQPKFKKYHSIIETTLTHNYQIAS